ncbi:hypothetical protein CEXT_754931 [Caerostris extrusa]|uniref:Uncharacterized protein n=1 Tax=Caerostris extrusa TaxID=172846 RepID=A0AAV4TPA7_CAEEX|nr:hypothetical protein CEXT_754931 [Caerostris extrusa]
MSTTFFFCSPRDKDQKCTGKRGASKGESSPQAVVLTTIQMNERERARGSPLPLERKHVSTGARVDSLHTYCQRDTNVSWRVNQ